MDTTALAFEDCELELLLKAVVCSIACAEVLKVPFFSDINHLYAMRDVITNFLSENKSSEVKGGDEE